MNTITIGLGIALTASVAQITGFLFQHVGAAERRPVTPRHPIQTLRSVFRSGWWLIGLVLGGLGFALHVFALSLAPLSLVQAFLAGGLALTAPVAAIGFGHRLSATEVRAVLLMAAALAVLPLGVVSHGNRFGFEETRLALYLGAATFATLAAVLLVRGRHRSFALGLAGGFFYGILDTSIKAITDLGHHESIGAALLSPWFLVALGAGVGGFFCFQRALQIGRPVTAIALTEAGAESVSIIGGFVAFGDLLGGSVPIAALHVIAFLAVGVATWRLAPAQELLTHPSRPDEPAAGEAQGEWHLSSPEPPAVGPSEGERSHRDTQRV